MRVAHTPADEPAPLTTHPYDALAPEVVLDAVEQYGGRCTGALLALNSYENRVYRVGREDAPPVVAKFYRPGRWSEAQLREEHAFLQELAEAEIPVVPPIAGPNGDTLQRFHGFFLSLSPFQPGRAPELNSDTDREILGRFLGRLHRVGQSERFAARPRLTIELFGRRALALLLASPFVPPELRDNVRVLSEQLLVRIEAIFETVGPIPHLRLHGDCHLSNILWGDYGPYFVDFDDCLTGPAVQDLWMLLAGDREDAQEQLAPVLAGYTQFMNFDPIELLLIEPLRTLRQLRYNAWIAERWEDPAFPHNFPWFPTQRHWETFVLTLREQLAALDEPPLAWQSS